MTNPIAKCLGIPDDNVWDWIHVYKACLLEEILRGRGAAGEFRELICSDRSEYRDEYYQQLGWTWFGVRGVTLDDIRDEHQTFFAHSARCSNTKKSEDNLSRCDSCLLVDRFGGR
jgi:hypothetical protein